MNFATMLEKAQAFHRHKCVGLVLGTRIAMAGLRQLGLATESQLRDLMVYVEVDRCLADAIQAITGCSLGNRRLKYVDYGKFAATFLDMSSKAAVRVSVQEKARKLVTKYGEERGLLTKGTISDKKQKMDLMSDAYAEMTDKDLLDIKKVLVHISEWDLPGYPKRKVTCMKCGERIFDNREKTKNGKILCKACAEGAYYTPSS